MTTQYKNYIITRAKGGKNYKVQNIYEDEEVFIPVDEVKELVKKTSLNKSSISILLSRIEKKRKDCKYRCKKIKREIKISKLCILLRYFTKEEVLSYIEKLDYYQIFRIFNSENLEEELLDEINE